MAEPVSRDQFLRRERGKGNVDFPCSVDHEQDWQTYPVDAYSAIYYVMTIHTYCAVCVLSSHLFWTLSLWTYQLGSHRQEEGHTGLLHLSSTVLVLIFLARRIQSFLSLVDREVEFCALLQRINRPPFICWAFFYYLFIYLFLCEEKYQVV